MTPPEPVDVFVDTEFKDTGRTVDLISIGLAVPIVDPGRPFTVAEWVTYYAVNASHGFKHVYEDPWLKENVWPWLPMRSDPDGFEWVDFADPSVKPDVDIAAEVSTWLGQWAGRPVRLWAYCASHDFVALSQLWGPLNAKPDHVPWRIRDVAQYADHLGYDLVGMPNHHGRNLAGLPKHHGREHHALDDAKWACLAKLHLDRYAFDQGATTLPGNISLIG